MKLKILTGALALLLTGSVLTGFSTQAAPSKTEFDDHQAQEISEAVFRMDGAAAQVDRSVARVRIIGIPRIFLSHTKKAAGLGKPTAFRLK